MASILLEVSCPVIRFEPSFLEQDDKIVRVYARAFEASSGSEPKPWHPNADAKDHTAIEACEARVAVVKDTDDALGIATATLTSFNFRSVGVELPNVDELSVSALLSKTAVVEFRLIAGATADIGGDADVHTQGAGTGAIEESAAEKQVGGRAEGDAGALIRDALSHAIV